MRWTASDFERLDPKLFRAFLAVVRTRSFSAAAVEVSLTQGAISQQIAKLEDRLHTQLFVRSGNSLITTPAGQLLASHAQAYMDHTSRFLEQLNEQFESMRGLVSYAMPESCIHSPHFSWLLESRKAHPDIVLHIELKPSSEVLRDLLNGDIDFGFVNQQIDSPAVQSYPFCLEDYVLVCAGGRVDAQLPSSLDALLAEPMIVYPGMIECLNRWTDVRFKGCDPVSPVALRVTGEFNDMRGAIAMVEGDLGWSVMPRHVVASRVACHALQIVGESAGASPALAQQQIWIVRLKERRMAARVRRVIRWFLDMHADLQPVPQEFLI